MLVELGNPAPKATPGDITPRVTYIRIPEHDRNGVGGYSQPAVHDDTLFPDELASVLTAGMDRKTRRLLIDGYLAHPSGVKGFPYHEAFRIVLADWVNHSSADPSWVWSDHAGLEQMLADYFGCPIGAPADVEDTHWTRNGMPGVGPGPYGGATMLETNAGYDLHALETGGGLLGETGTATATTATSLTTNSATSHVTNDLAGQTVIAWSSGAYGYIVSNTSGTNTVLTVDRWSVPATPGGTAASTPSGTTGYTIMCGSLPAFFMALTANSGAPASGDTTLTGEITTASGGLIAKICPYAHTAGTNTFTLTPVFTCNGSDSLPVTVAKIGVGPSIVSTVKKMFQTLLNATATFSLSGDQATVTETISI